MTDILQLFNVFSYRMPVTSVDPLSGFCPRSFRLAKQKTRAQCDMGQRGEALMLCTRDLWSKVPELSDEALVIREWCWWINVSWGRDIIETSNLKFLLDWGPVEHLEDPGTHWSHDPCLGGIETLYMGTCLLVPLLTSYRKTGLLVIFSKLFLFSQVFSCKIRWLSSWS